MLHLSEHAAYLRIEAARAVRKYPVLLEQLEAGDITLTTIGLVAPHFTPGNHQHLVEAARHKSKREVEQLVAVRHPQPAVASAIRKLPRPARQERGDAPADADTSSLLSVAATMAPAVSTVSPVAAMATSPSSGESPRVPPATKPPIVKPLDAERYRVQFTVTRDTFDKLRRVQDLLRHTCADGDLAVVFDRALTMLLEHVERTTLARVSRPRPPPGAPARSRLIPAAVRRARLDARRRPVCVRGRGRAMHQAAFSNSTTSCRSRTEAPRRSRTSSCAVEPIINMSPTVVRRGIATGARVPRACRLDCSSVRTELMRHPELRVVSPPVSHPLATSQE